MPTSPRYSLVASDSSSVDEELPLTSDKHASQLCAHCQHSLSRSASVSSSSASYWAIVVSLVSVCLNCIIFLGSSKLPERCIDPMMSVTNENIHLLPRPNPFIGMENITRPVPPVQREFYNFPQIIQQVNSKDPQFVYDDDPLRYMSSRGLVSPEERRIQVTDSVSTLFQFRAVDYGMEKCELHVNFPVNSTTNTTSLPFVVSLHRLDSSLPLNTRILSYANKPRVTSTMAELRISPNSNEEINWWQQFDCKWDQLFTFELACYDPARLGGGESGKCWLEWWQDRAGKDPKPAVYIKQLSTV